MTSCTAGLQLTAMDINNKTKTETFLRTVLKTLEVSREGKVSSEEVGRVMSALGRPQDEETRQNLLNKHRGKASSSLLSDILLYPVTDTVEEFVLSAGFTTYDQVVGLETCQ